MPPRFVSTVLAYLINALAFALIVGVLALIVWATGGARGSPLTTIADALFLAGGIILTFGALAEFVHLKGMTKIRKMLFITHYLPDQYDFPETAFTDKEGKEVETGWPFIYIGALLVTFSIVASLNYLI